MTRTESRRGKYTWRLSDCDLKIGKFGQLLRQLINRRHWHQARGGVIVCAAETTGR